MLREDEHYADKIPLVNTSCNTSNEHEESREHEEEVSNQTESAAAATEPVNNLYGNSNIKNKTRLNPTLAKFYKRHCIYSSYRHTNNYSKLYLNNSAFKHYYNKKHKQFSDSLKYYKWYYHHQHHLHSKKEQQQVSWIPPINADTLEELSISHMFKSLQLRHDLLSDPHLYFRPNLDGPSGREKRKRADRYWKRVECAFQHDQEYDFLRIIMLELVKILKTLINPFENHSVLSSTFRWNFPDYISAENLQDIFDPELMIQQLKFNCLDISKQLSCLELIFQHLCPNQPLIEVMKQYFIENSFAKALRQCFIILEIIKLVRINDCLFFFLLIANKQTNIGLCQSYSAPLSSSFDRKLCRV
jgi:hypothetical protein